MTRYIILLILGWLVSCNATEKQSTKAPFKTIRLQTQGVTEVEPDIATFNVLLTCLKPTTSSSKACLVEKSQALNEKLLALGINKSDMLTTSINMRKEYQWTAQNDRTFKGYQNSTTLHIKVESLDALSEIYTELIENKNLEIYGLYYSHSQRDSLKRTAYIKALHKANRLADQLLKELPETKKEILQISNVKLSSDLPYGELTNALGYEEETALELEEAIYVPLNQGTVKVRSVILVEYRIL